MDHNQDNNYDSNMAGEQNEYDEEFENDIYLLALQKRLASMKKERKKTENDALLLQNRLNLLKGEEDKVFF
jgi:hypothetical protein